MCGILSVCSALAALTPAPDVSPRQMCTVLPGTSESPPAETAGVDCSVIDVMVVYTPSARVRLGGTAATEAVIDSYFEYTDTVFQQSGVLHRFRLVHGEEIAYVKSGNSITDLARLKDPGDGVVNVTDLLDLLGAWGACP